MIETIVPTATIGVDALAIAEEEAAKAYGRAVKSGRTRTEYARDWAQFAAWCAERGLASLPSSAPVGARYLGTLGERLKIASIRRRVVAISQAHKERGFESPTAHKLVREVVTGIARTHGSAQTRKAAITADVLSTLLKSLDRESQAVSGTARSCSSGSRVRFGGRNSRRSTSPTSLSRIAAWS